MKAILKRTLVDTLKLPAIILMLAAGIGSGVLLAENAALADVPAYTTYLNSCLMRQHFIVFFLIDGGILLLLTVSVCSGLIAGEVHEGTFRILIAKPNSRITILIAKILGMFLGIMIIMLMGLSTMYLTEILAGNWDGNIVNDLLSYFPGYILYGLISSFFISSLAVLISTLAKKRVIALLPMLAVVLLILAVPIIFRVVFTFSGRSMPGILNLFDLNYHFGSMFRWCCQLCGPFSGSNSQKEVASLLMNTFISQAIDRDILRNYGNSMYTINDTLPALAIVLVYMILGFINYIASILVMNNKNV